jgi:copper transport protein
VSRSARTGAIVAAAVAALALPAAAAAHAVLVRTVPAASGTVNTPPRQLALTYSEAVEPRFAIVSVTDSSDPPRQESAGPPRRSPGEHPDTLLVPLRHIAEGWYLVYWRAISVDGHPVRGAFTFAVGPNPGPAPQFVIPSTSETAATPKLIVARWAVFLAVMGAIGLLVLRLAVARPVARLVSGAHLRHVTIAFCVTAAVGLAAIPAYLFLATADFALRSVFDIGALVPLLHVSAFGRGYLDLELCFALFVGAGLIALWVDRPERDRRSIAEILASLGVASAAGATLLVPGAAGHAAQTAPRGLSLLFDWLHLAAGSLWFGGLLGLLVLWRSLPVASRVAGLLVAVPRFSNVAFGSVLLLIGSGTGASILHLPTVGSLWQTSYGQAVLVKVGLLLVVLGIAAVNLLRTKPGLARSADDATVGTSTARLLRRLVAGEAALVAGVILAAAVLSSLAPPSKALASVGHASARVGPGPVATTVEKQGYRLAVRVAPNRTAVPNSFAVRITHNGRPVRGAGVIVSFAMLDMEMGQQEYRLSETRPGVYSRAAPALVMVGHWGLSFEVTPPGRQPFDVLFVDHATG